MAGLDRRTESTDSAHAFLASLPLAACLADANGCVVAANAEFGWFLGVPAEEVDGSDLGTLIGPDSDVALGERFREALACQSVFAGELLTYAQRGQPIWNDLIVVPARHGTGSLVLCRDVTARHNAETALGVRPSTDRHVLDRVQAGIVVHKATTEILYANAKATELLGVTHETAIGAVNTDPRWGFVGADGLVLPIEDYPVGKAVRTKAMVRNLLLGLDRTSDHKQVWIMCNAYPVLGDDGEVTEVVVSFTDVTELKQTERALQKSQERLELVLRGSRDAPWDWDMRTHEIYYSPRWWEMVGYQPGELPADEQMWVQLMHPDDRAAIREQLERLIADGASTYETEFRLVHRSGADVRVLSRGFILRDDAGAAIRISGMNTDITERRALEARLQQSQKMEAIGQLAGGVAHDFNNLLAVIVGNLELLRTAIPESSIDRECLDDALNAAQRGAAVTRRLLTFSRQQPLTPAAVDVGRLIHDLGTVLHRLIGEIIQVRTHLAPGLPSIQADASLLENAILNLSINARDAMPDGGTITIIAEAYHVGTTPRAVDVDLAPGAYVRLSIQDTGVGMSRETVARALEPFFTTKPVGQGTGLGLSMAYGFVRQSGGTLTIASSPGAGTTINLFLPATDSAAAARRTPTLAPAPSTAQREEVVLVVEDDPSVRRLCIRSLSALGYVTIEAGSGPEALRALAVAPRVDLVLTDVVMPNGMSGKDLAEELRRRRPGLRLLYMSGYPAHMLDHELAEASTQLLRKPFSLGELGAAMRTAMA